MNDRTDHAFDIFPWNRNFESGIPLVDEQHKELVRIINHLAAHLGNQSSPAELNQVFADLAAYADYHFKTEESLWAPVYGDDPDYLAHKHTHDSFMVKVSELKSEEQTRPLEKVVEDILHFLTHWLAYHILDSDKRMAQTLLALQDGLSFEQARLRAEQEMRGSMQIMIESVLLMYDHLSSRTLDLMRERNERSKIERALQQSEQREKAFSDTMMRSIPGLLYLFDEQLRLIRWNDRFGDASGYASDELANKHLLDFFEEKHHQAIRDNVASFFDGGYIETEGRLLSKNGESAPFLFTSVPLAIEGEKYFIGVGVDISRRKQAERRLRMLSSSVEQANDAILITDMDGTICYVNPAFSRLTGFDEAEAIGKNPSMLNSGMQNDLFYRKMWQAISNGEAWQGRVVDRKKDGSFYPAMLTISPIRHASGRIENFIGIQQDLSAYENLEMQFHQAQKMEAIGTLVGGIAHDFNNMLAGIIANLYLLQRRIPNMPEVSQKLKNMEQLAFRAADMIRQLLTFARRDSVDIRSFPLTPFIKETFKLLHTSIPENIELQKDICSDALMINGDSTQLHQVLLNLLNNARDALEGIASPCITICLAPFTTDDAFRALHPAFPAGNYAHLRVIDNGCGIPANQIEHLFEPFFTTKEPGKGTGLGLAMVFGAIQNHHGFMDVESKPGMGTTFHVYLPLLEDGTPRAALQPREEAVENGAGEWILLVDDDPQVISVGRELLESMGYRVATAADGLQAIDVFTAHRNDIALVMMDVVMPSMGGVMAAEKIREIKPGIKVLYCTGYDKSASIPGNLPEGIEVFSKPYNIVELSRTIKRLLHT